MLYRTSFIETQKSYRFILYNNKTIFNLLITAFVSDIADLKDDMPSHRKNIIHHMFGVNSLAKLDMQNEVFDCLERTYTPETIFNMMCEEDARCNKAFWYAQNYGIGIDKFSERMSCYVAALDMEAIKSETAPLHAQTFFAQSPRRMESLEASATLSMMHNTTMNGIQ